MFGLTTRRLALWTTLALVPAASLLMPGCATVPKAKDRAKVVNDSRSAVSWFERNVRGLNQQMSSSAGYIVFPKIGQYGILISGSKFGRGVAYNNAGQQMGWAYINTITGGLQVGVQGHMMLVILQDEQTLRNFQDNKLSGNVSATAVAASEGGSSTGAFNNGVAIYTGSAKGLMVGASVGLEYLRYEPVGADVD